MIKPTVGRVVWYKARYGDVYPGADDGYQAAIVTKVWSDTCVNLVVFDANGGTFGRTSVLLVQPENECPECGYCTWMPYQIEQVKKNSV